MSEEISKTIIICPDCNGHGIRKWIENIAGHNLEQIPHEATCEACKGSGRMVQVLIQIPFEATT